MVSQLSHSITLLVTGETAFDTKTPFEHIRALSEPYFQLLPRMSSLSLNESIVAICEFLEVATHTILYLRQIYPSDVFVRRKKYDTPVYQSRHFGLNEYITGSIKAVGRELMSGKVKSVSVVLKDRFDTALERFVFSVESVISVGNQDKNIPIPDAVTRAELIQNFRAFLIKLYTVEAQIPHLAVEEDQPTFAIVIEMKENATPSAAKGEDIMPWIPASRQHTAAGTSEESELHVVRAYETGIFNLSLAIQESAVKLERERRRNGKGKQRAF